MYVVRVKCLPDFRRTACDVMPETKAPLISSKWQHLIANRIYISGVRVQIGPFTLIVFGELNHIIRT